MNVWINTKFKGHYPVGVAAVVVARTRQIAADILNAELSDYGLEMSAEPDQFIRLKTDRTQALVLADGNY